MAERDADGTDRARAPDVDLDRRRALKLLGGGAVGAGAARAADNVLLGYGILTGTNLIEQDLGGIAGQHLRPSPFALGFPEHRLVFNGEWLGIRDDAGEQVDAIHIAEADPNRAGSLDAEYDLPGGSLRALARDLAAVEAGDVAFEFADWRGFFDRLEAAETRPLTVAALRGARFERPAPATIQRFTDAEPTEPATLVEGLAAGFRAHTDYDIPRYIAGSIQDNVVMGAVRLRKYFRSPTDFEAMLSDRASGLFCYEFTFRSIEAFHAAAPHRQTPPVFGAIVTDARHKHVYTGLASAIREDGGLRIPMTFLDYTHATLYDDLRIRWALGEGVDAYNDRHRASDVYWNRYTRWV